MRDNRRLFLLPLAGEGGGAVAGPDEGSRKEWTAKAVEAPHWVPDDPHQPTNGRIQTRALARTPWREDHHRVLNGEQYLIIAAASQARPVSRQGKGYWQRRA